MFRVNEIFASIEGEGIKIGRLQVFVRFQGCSIHCSHCDTPQSWDPNKGTHYTTSELLDAIIKFNIPIVSLTGGAVEEQDHEELKSLIIALKNIGYIINIEASGQYADDEILSIFSLCDTVSCDIKPPSTGIQQNLDMIKKIASVVGMSGQFKVVIETKDDWQWIKKVSEELLELGQIILTPCWKLHGSVDTQFIQKIIEDMRQYSLNQFRLIIQQHKVIYGPNKSGV